MCIRDRVFTEWYKSKGYNFQITNSTSYDQYYVHGRDIFEPMDRITDDIFNTYVRRPGTIDPYYTEYCDGKTVTCKGMKQWGTVTLAESGKSALEILKYYYGNNLEIVRTNNIADIPESYPGTPLRLGSTGTVSYTHLCEMHSTCMLHSGDEGTLRKMGLRLTSEPEYPSKDLFF